MCDFDLAQALDSPLGFDDTGPESRCFDMTDVKKEIINLDTGLNLEISCNPKTMKSVATLVMAVNRMKKSPTRSSWELRGDELCSVIMDSLVDETVVKTVADATTGQRSIKFVRARSEECTLSDTQKKDIICTPGDLKLQAVTLKGGYADRKVNFKLVKYISIGAGQTFVLSIKNDHSHKFYLSCVKNSNNAELHLEECSEDDIRNDMDRFLFEKKLSGKSQTSFESVKHRGWFISTSESENQPVELCQIDSAQRVTSFNVSSKKPLIG
ncbi:interleukin-1 beta-like [Seriola lalandi dorsalis]|nr:interleukin-1 beta-like [Seriola lalandi dorsalis]XP_056258760.1 interleukin-1 beta [Seriola aureovittata]